MLQKPLKLSESASFRILVISNPDNKAAVDDCKVLGEAVRGGRWITWGRKKAGGEKITPLKGLKVEGCGLVCQCYSEA